MCEDQLLDAVQSSQKALLRATDEISKPSAKERELLSKFRTKCAPQRNGDDFEVTLECASTVACPVEWDSFRDCLDANSGDYAAASCTASGMRFSRCLGERATRLLLMYETFKDGDGGFNNSH